MCFTNNRLTSLRESLGWFMSISDNSGRSDIGPKYRTGGVPDPKIPAGVGGVRYLKLSDRQLNEVDLGEIRGRAIYRIHARFWPL